MTPEERKRLVAMFVGACKRIAKAPVECQYLMALGLMVQVRAVPSLTEVAEVTIHAGQDNLTGREAQVQNLSGVTDPSVKVGARCTIVARYMGQEQLDNYACPTLRLVVELEGGLLAHVAPENLLLLNDPMARDKGCDAGCGGDDVPDLSPDED